MSKPLVSDELWALSPAAAIRTTQAQGWATRSRDRAALAGIIFVLRPASLGRCCRASWASGMTCWRRLRDWQEAGVWAGLHRVLLERLSDAGQLDWSRASLDSASVAAKRGAPRPARTRRIAANRARSAMLWSTGGAPRSGSA